MGSLGGSVAWYGRPLAELHALAENLERRLKAFWTYREPDRRVQIEVVAVFGADQQQERWAREGEQDAWADAQRLLARSEVLSDQHGMLDTFLGISTAQLRRFCATQPAALREGRTSIDELRGVKIRAVLMPLLEGQQPEQGTWHYLHIDRSAPAPRSVRLISDVDDTVRRDARRGAPCG
jgi:hypothetical protein